ncbi:hypothetical protein HXX76_011586 [Chlamydomonas incerta]|uniref:Uncharacterized protein n=1 Tax=Chlamydomonas incerta TaxID=51695 RepID=A0A835SJS4_CHLIN|nr:hypothetical protein HXX76_011586 [Chlamydomonas incerta]|eukprot:KAG2428467.1 hypothetical protein HXX76_011586 [Chlamydomonas incerta]
MDRTVVWPRASAAVRAGDSITTSSVAAWGLLPAGAALLPAGAAALPTGATLLPAGAALLPAGMTLLPAGATLLPAGATLLPAGATLLPAGAALLPAGAALRLGLTNAAGHCPYTGSSSAAVAASCHVMVVVDASGSMRKSDVPDANGCISRIAAVYDCVARELVAPQLQLVQAMTLIEMRDTASICFSRQPFGAELLALVKQHAARADGAPSDHTSVRGMTQWDVRTACVDAVAQLATAAGGADRVSAHMVAFGPPSEEFYVLQDMAGALPQGLLPGAGAKLGLSAVQLRTAFSTISSSLSSLLTDLGTGSGGGGGLGATVRPAVMPTTARLDYDEGFRIRSDDAGWLLYPRGAVVSHVRYNASGQQMPLIKHALQQRGLAVRRQKFSEGAERAVFQATEVDVGSWDRGWVCGGTGSRVVDMLVEQELEGQLVKWNNNNGLVVHGIGGIKEGAGAGGGGGGGRAAMGAIAEDDSKEYDAQLLVDSVAGWLQSFAARYCPAWLQQALPVVVQTWLGGIALQVAVFFATGAVEYLIMWLLFAAAQLLP